MALFDDNRWYQITIPLFPKQSLVGSRSNSSSSTAAVFFHATNTSALTQRWQLFNIETNRYILRSQASGPESYLAIQQTSDSTNKNGGSVAIMRNVNGASDEVFWRILRVQNAGYTLINTANGTNFHLHAENADIVSMTSNNTGDQDDQKFSFTPSPSGLINNATFSTIKLPSGAVVTATSQPDAQATHKISTGATVGAAIGGVALIALLIALFFLLRRRRRNKSMKKVLPQHDHEIKAELDAEQQSHGRDLVMMDPVTKKPTTDVHHELHGQARVQELDAAGRPPMPNSPVELPANHMERARS